MPTSFDDIFFLIDPSSPPADGTFLGTSTLTVTDQNDNGQIARGGNDSIEGVDISWVYPGDTVTIETEDGQQITYEGATFYLSNGTQVFSPIDGQTLQPGTLVDTTFVFGQAGVTPEQLEALPCFTPGTRIKTPSGWRKIERMRPGDLVITQDHGPQPIRWIGQRSVAGQGAMAPIRIMAGAMGNTRDLRVSPQHRMLVSGWQAQLGWGEDEVLIAAKHLVNGDTIHHAPCREVAYIHLLFDRHEIIFAEGAATESFHPGDFILDHDVGTQAELLQIFPELSDRQRTHWETARKIAKAHEVAALRPPAA